MGCANVSAYAGKISGVPRRVSTIGRWQHRVASRDNARQAGCVVLKVRLHDFAAFDLDEMYRRNVLPAFVPSRPLLRKHDVTVYAVDLHVPKSTGNCRGVW